jgi:cyclophilin family peptidyl-prolyl cis-trans isomerase
MTRILAALTALLFSLAVTEASAVEIKDPENTLVIELKTGKVYIEMLPQVAPKHVEQIKTLARQGFYDGVVFHRVIEGFMAQTGDPTGTGRGGSKLDDIPAEFSNVPFERGTVGMARSQDPNSANSQFFIMFAPGDFLNGNYTVVGQVTEGLEVLDAIKRGEGQSGAVQGAPDVMQSVTVTR